MSFDSADVVTSVHNPAIKRARSLLRRKGRLEERAFLVEGLRAVKDMIAAGVIPSVLYVRDTTEDRRLLDDIVASYPVRFVLPSVFAGLSDVEHPQGIVAIVAMESVPTTPRFDVWNEPLILVADGVRDPGNLGTLVRSAAGAGVTEVLVTPNSVDPLNPKCVRAGMGAHFLVSIRRLEWDAVVTALSHVSNIVIADADGRETYDAVDWRPAAAIVVGSEAAGPHDRVRDMATSSVRIPLARHLESLNAGVAGSHIVLEAARQRRSAKLHG